MNTFHITNRLLKSTLFCGLLLFSSSALSCSSDDDGGGNGGTQLEWLEPIRVASYNIQYDNRNEEAGRWENRKEIVCRLLEAEDFDIFGAQEPYKFQIEDMAAALPGYTWIGTSVTGEDTVERRHFNPIFYKTNSKCSKAVRSGIRRRPTFPIRNSPTPIPRACAIGRISA